MSDSHSPSFWVIDMSNSFTKVALVRRGKLGAIKRTLTSKLSRLWLEKAIGASRIRRAVLAGVVPKKDAVIRALFSDGIFEVTGTAGLGMAIEYPKPGEIGADRLANAVAGRELYGAPCVLIDFGTAVTFEVVNKRGAFCGGAIAPGLSMMTDYLHDRTALLPRVTLREPARVIAQSTSEAMRSGAVIGYRGLIRELLAGIRKELGGRRHVPVVACGGDATLMAQKLPEIDAVNPLLTLEGLRIIGTRAFS